MPEELSQETRVNIGKIAGGSGVPATISSKKRQKDGNTPNLEIPVISCQGKKPLRKCLKKVKMAIAP